MQRRATIQDVAKAAGVGKVTVSYVLNGRGEEARISAPTRERVLKAAEALSYRPNAMARGLKTRRADAIAVVFQYADYFAATSSFVPELMAGVCAACVDAGLDVVLHTRRFDDPGAEAAALADGRVDGVLLLRDADDPLLPALKATGLPTVSFFSRPLGADGPYADCDNVAGGRIAAEHLLGLGHRRLGMVTGGAGSVAASDRRDGFLDAAPDSKLFLWPLERLADWITDERITGLFVWSDDSAFEAVRLLREAGLAVPEDVSVVGFDSSPACERFSPALTSVRQPVREIAAGAVRLLTRVVAGLPVDPMIVAPVLDVRASCAPAPAKKQS